MKKLTYRGKALDDMKGMGIDEFARTLPARQRRSLLRGFTENQKKLIAKIMKDPKKFHKTHCRDLIIVPEMVGVMLGVHNGKEFVRLEIKPEMVGHRLGEFVLTRKGVKHSAPGFGATRSSKYVPLK